MLLPNEFMFMIQGKVGFKSRARHDFGSLRAVSGAPRPRRPRFAGPAGPLRGPAPFFPGSFSPFGPTPTFLQKPAMQQFSQKALRAVHTALPWSTSLWQKLLDSSGGSTAHRSFSTFSGAVLAVSPSRPAMRMQWVSVTTAGLPYTSPSTRLAVLRPTPGSFSRSSMLSGTLPPNSSLIIRQAPKMSLALARQNPQEWMSSPISSSVPSQKASRVGKRLNNAGVTRFTRASVH